MKIKQTTTAVAVAILVSGLSGCAMLNKGTMHYTRTTTIGQELVDLQVAKEKGALSEEEYIEMKEEILDSVITINCTATSSESK